MEELTQLWFPCLTLKLRFFLVFFYMLTKVLPHHVIPSAVRGKIVPGNVSYVNVSLGQKELLGLLCNIIYHHVLKVEGRVRECPMT